MPRVFISYRRSDSITITGRIYDRLVDAFGEENVFKDVDNIPIGVDFRSVLNREVGSAQVLLMIIGKAWVNASDDQGRRRLDDPADFVRIEAEHGLARKTMLVIPVLVNGASMPQAMDLPESIRDLAFRNAAVVRDDPDFRRDMTRLIEQIRKFTEDDDAPTAVINPVEVAAARRAAEAPPARDPFEDIVPTTRPPASESPVSAPPPAPKPPPGQVYVFDQTTEHPAAAAGNRNRWILIGVGVFILAAVGCFACEILSSLGRVGYY